MSGDAFSDEITGETTALTREKFGKVDCVIDSFASPRRTDPVSGGIYTSVLKPIGSPGIFRDIFEGGGFQWQQSFPVRPFPRSHCHRSLAAGQ
jgi:hypothetical protein